MAPTSPSLLAEISTVDSSNIVIIDGAYYAKLLEELAETRAVVFGPGEGARDQGLPLEAIMAIAEGSLTPLRAWRIERGMKAIELVRSTGLSQSYVSNLENGRKSVLDATVAAATKLARALGVDIEDITPQA